MARQHHPHSRVVTAPVRIPKQLRDGDARCAACSAAVRLNPNGTLRSHVAPSGDPCAHRAGYLRIRLDEVPPVVLGNPRRGSTTAVAEQGRSRLDVGSCCEECGKWIPGERQFCGRCMAKRPC